MADCFDAVYRIYKRHTARDSAAAFSEAKPIRMTTSYDAWRSEIYARDSSEEGPDVVVFSSKQSSLRDVRRPQTSPLAVVRALMKKLKKKTLLVLRPLRIRSSFKEHDFLEEKGL